MKTIIKTLLVSSFIFISNQALASDPMTDLAKDIANMVEHHSTKVSKTDRRKIQRKLFEIEAIFGDYDLEPVESTDPITKPINEVNWICLSNGLSGSSERFNIYDVAKKENIGSYAKKDSCLMSIDNINEQGMMCVSNGLSGSSERFQLYDIDKKQSIGSWSSKASCMQTL